MEGLSTVKQGKPNKKRAGCLIRRLSERSLFAGITLTLLLAMSVTNGFCDEGQWSSKATDVTFSISTMKNRSERNVAIPSPDGRKRVIVGEYKLDVENDREPMTTQGTDDFGVEAIAELSWSPDSAAFFLTQNDGGLVGTYDVVVYKLHDPHVLRIEVSNKVRKDFMKRYNCDVWGDNQGNETPNIAGVAWLKGSAELLLVAEVPPHSSCPEMGKFMGYAVSIPSGNIVARYSAREVKNRWGGSLGPRHSRDEQYDTTNDKLSPWPKNPNNGKARKLPPSPNPQIP